LRLSSCTLLISAACSDSTVVINGDAAAIEQAPADASSGAPGYTLVYNDPLFKEMFVDVDEWRDEPVRHRYVHGGFTDTEARFSIYFPPEDKYDGRFSCSSMSCPAMASQSQPNRPNPARIQAEPAPQPLDRGR
jgi:hypothetical protein